MPDTTRKQLVLEFFEVLSAFFRLMGAKKDLALKLQLNRAQFELLMILENEQSLAVGKIAERMVMTSSAATQLVDGLVQLTLVDRTEDPKDRRRSQIAISQVGQQRLKQAKAMFLDQIEQRLVSLSDTDLQTITHHFQHILQALHSEPAG